MAAMGQRRGGASVTGLRPGQSPASERTMGTVFCQTRIRQKENRQYLLVANRRPNNDPIRLSMRAPIIPRHQSCATAIGTPS